MSTNKKITILIPCYNESAGVGSVIDGFKAVADRTPDYDFEIIAVDNNSKDSTSEVAKRHGAAVHFEGKKGKGNAMRSAFAQISADTDFVVMLDGDDTYRASEVMRLIEPLEAGFCTVVLGSRLKGKMQNNAMSAFNRFGNHFFTALARVFYGVQATDVLTGYYAWKADAVRKMTPHLTSEGFTIEIEMVAKMAKLGESIFSVPINYDARAGESNLKPVEDGIKILKVLIGNLFWNPVKKTPVSAVPDELDDVLVQGI
jgi:glycosyltransferase involved in cell wall biosynthesis